MANRNRLIEELRQGPPLPPVTREDRERAAAAFCRHESHEKEHAQHNRPEDDGTGPTAFRCGNQAKYEQSEPEKSQRGPQPIQTFPCFGIDTFRHVPQGNENCGHCDDGVDQEDCAP